MKKTGEGTNWRGRLTLTLITVNRACNLSHCHCAFVRPLTSTCKIKHRQVPSRGGGDNRGYSRNSRVNSANSASMMLPFDFDDLSLTLIHCAAQKTLATSDLELLLRFDKLDSARGREGDLFEITKIRKSLVCQHQSPLKSV